MLAHLWSHTIRIFSHAQSLSGISSTKYLYSSKFIPKYDISWHAKKAKKNNLINKRRFLKFLLKGALLEDGSQLHMSPFPYTRTRMISRYRWNESDLGGTEIITQFHIIKKVNLINIETIKCEISKMSFDFNTLIVWLILPIYDDHTPAYHQ